MCNIKANWHICNSYESFAYQSVLLKLTTLFHPQWNLNGYGTGPQPFWHHGLVSWKTSFPGTRGKGGGFGVIQMHYIYCALYFYFYCISSTSDHQALDPGGWEPLSQDKTLGCLHQTLAVMKSKVGNDSKQQRDQMARLPGTSSGWECPRMDRQGPNPVEQEPNPLPSNHCASLL